MRTVALVFLFCVFSITVFGQSENLIYNGSFEKHTECPDNFGMYVRERNVFGWESPNWGTPDYFNVCSEKSGVPDNWVGSADAFHGNAYIGLIACMQQNNKKQIAYREYISTRLIHPLDSGKMYYASMMVRLGLSCNTACNGLGIFFSETPMNSVRSSNFPVKPYILKNNDPVIDNKEEWVKVCGVFQAFGNERYITIGNFWSNQDMTYVSFDENYIPTISVSPIAYYYIDFVEVYESDATYMAACEASDQTGVLAFSGQIPISGKIVLGNVHFEHDKALILEESFNELNIFAAALHRQSDLRISINGHTDNTGGDQYNLDLSLERAKAVKDFLIERGISNYAIEIKGLGNAFPVADNTTEVGRKKNRRVEVEVIQ